MSEETPFTPRLGRIGDQGKGSGRPAARKLRRAIAKLPRATRASFTGARSGAGRAAGTRGLQTGRLSRLHMRRVVVKVHIARGGRSGPGLYRAHLGYLQRDGVDRDGESGVLYDRDSDSVDARGFLERSEQDRHQFRIIVSPEDGARLGDLKSATRDLMAQMERDLGRRLDWVAVDHHNTGHSHTHIVIRGRDARMRDVVIARDYLMNGLRDTAEDLVTQRLGPRRALEIAQARESEVSQDRWTGLDREINAAVQGGRIELDDASGSRGRFDRALKLRRLRHLESLGLARRLDERAFEMKTGWQDRLKREARRGDIIRTLAADYTKQARTVSFIEELKPGTDRIRGLVKAYGPKDELRDTRFLLVEDFDSRVWHVPAGAVDMAPPPMQGAVVELRRASAMARPSDRAIAAVADTAGGIWSEELHARHDPGSKPDYRLSLKRRLEALRQAGIGVRLATGEWQGGEDFLERAASHEARASGGVRLAVLSWVPVEQQVRFRGETWLDRATEAEAPAETPIGRLRAQRQAWLREQGYLGEGQDRLTDDQRARLRVMELTRASAAIAARTSREALTLQPGDGFEGTLEGHVDLGAGRMAIVGNAKEFTLVPWREALGRQIGRELSIQRTARGLSWSLGMERVRGLSR